MSENKGGTVVQMPPRKEVDLAREAERTSASPVDGAGIEFRFLPVDSIKTSPYQTRSFESEAGLEELARSVEQKGVLQPILVRPLATDDNGPSEFELIAGERRLRAARIAGLQFVPALIRPLEDLHAAQVSVIENAQRVELNPIEEALAYRQLVEQFGLKQTEVARAIGKNRATVSNALRLLQLEPEVIELLRQGELSAGHGRALLMIDDPELQTSVAFRAVRNSLSVHALEAFVKSLQYEQEDYEEFDEEEERRLAALERQAERVRSLLGLERVELKFDARDRRRLNLVFETEASWRRFMTKIRE